MKETIQYQWREWLQANRSKWSRLCQWLLYHLKQAVLHLILETVNTILDKKFHKLWFHNVLLLVQNLILILAQET